MLVEAAPNAIVLADVEGRILLVNAETERLFGYSRQELLGRPIEILVPERYRGTHPVFRTGYAGDPVARPMGAGRDLYGCRKDGSEFPVEIGLKPIRSEEGVFILSAIVDITARKEAEKARLEAASAADRQKDEFLAMLGHELRNPLAPMRNAIQLMKDLPPDEVPRGISRAVAILERQMQQMVRLVDDVLNVSGIIEGHIDLQRTALDLADVVARGVETAQPLIDQRRQQLLIRPPAEPLWVYGDLIRLSEVVANLLTNAAKYGPEQARIVLSASKEGSEACLRVTDEGIGIAPELLPRVFDLFVQGETSLARPQGGLGIGLTLVRRVVQLHGGRVTAYSAGRGRGSEFSVWLPLAESLPQATASALRTVPLAARLENPRRILVVDDNADMAETTALLLGNAGHTVQTASDGDSALSLAQEFHPQVVLLDVGLPDRSGYEVARQLRELPEMSGALIVAVTGYGQESDQQRARAAGFDHHLTKPVEPATLLALMATKR
jgi:two-component system CheB/CheR fusion protein